MNESMQSRIPASLQGLLGFSALLLALHAAGCGEAGAACPRPCGGSAPIRILYLGASSVPTWVQGALTGSAINSATGGSDCDGCTLTPGTDYVATAVSWGTAQGWPVESFRSFDILLTDSASGNGFTTVATTEPWLPIYAGARRVVATSMHVNSPAHLATHNGFAQFVQNVVRWLAEDECCQLPPGDGVIPAIFIANDSEVHPMKYTPWPGLRRAYSRGEPGESDFHCTTDAMYDDTVFIGSAHDIFAGNTDVRSGACAANSECSLDNSSQTVHTVWEANHSPCGFENHGFVAVQRVEIASPDVFGGTCVSVGPSNCDTSAAAADIVTLVRDFECCGGIEPAPDRPALSGCP
jgi:hypothetical protein